MKKIYNYLKTFWNEEVKVPYFLYIVAFLAISIFLEYHFHFFSQFIKPYKESLYHYFANILFYCIPVLAAVLGYIYFYGRGDLFGNRSFWFLLVFIVCFFSLRPYIYQYRYMVEAINNGKTDPFMLKCANQMAKALLVFVIVFLFWKFSGHAKEEPYYGFKLKGVEIKPYFVLLLIVLPLIVFASTQADFLHRYPTFKTFVGLKYINLTALGKISVYELFYGSDYVAIELFFRGFVLYSLSRFLGKGAIIPMATMYVFIHFGKPVGETISSFFGGIILGVIAYETKSIIGGIIVHCGIAYMMEIGGLIGNI